MVSARPFPLVSVILSLQCGVRDVARMVGWKVELTQQAYHCPGDLEEGWQWAGEFQHSKEEAVEGGDQRQEHCEEQAFC